MNLGRRISEYVKGEYNIALGEFTLSEAENDVTGSLREKLTITGRDYETGEKKMITITMQEMSFPERRARRDLPF